MQHDAEHLSTVLQNWLGTTMDTVGLNKEVGTHLQRAFIWRKLCLSQTRLQGAAWTMQPPEPEWVGGYSRVWKFSAGGDTEN